MNLTSSCKPTFAINMDSFSVQQHKLNSAKNSLNLPNFHLLKSSDKWENDLKLLRKSISFKYNAQNVTKAWLKFSEILNNTEVGPYLLSFPHTIHAFLNAELPGGFLFALNHYLKSHNRNLIWVISSYYPKNIHQTNYLPDNFNIIKNYPDNSLVGVLNTNKGVFWSDGDLTNPKMPTLLSHLAKSKLHTIHLYTADGGFGVEGNENLQEQLSLPLIKGEIETGMKCLAKGGIFILKIFTFFTPEMHSMLVYLLRHFQTYHIFKPSTSGPLNSESYFIGIGFYGLLDTNIKFPDPIDITNDEYSYLLNTMFDLTNSQIDNINNFINHIPIPLNVNLPLKPLSNQDKL